MSMYRRTGGTFLPEGLPTGIYVHIYLLAGIAGPPLLGRRVGQTLCRQPRRAPTSVVTYGGGVYNVADHTSYIVNAQEIYRVINRVT